MTVLANKKGKISRRIVESWQVATTIGLLILRRKIDITLRILRPTKLRIRFTSAPATAKITVRMTSALLKIQRRTKKKMKATHRLTSSVSISTRMSRAHRRARQTSQTVLAILKLKRVSKDFSES